MEITVLYTRFKMSGVDELVIFKKCFISVNLFKFTLTSKKHGLPEKSLSQPGGLRLKTHDLCMRICWIICVFSCIIFKHTSSFLESSTWRNYLSTCYMTPVQQAPVWSAEIGWLKLDTTKFLHFWALLSCLGDSETHYSTQFKKSNRTKLKYIFPLLCASCLLLLFFLLIVLILDSGTL